jgi:ABC-type uncharacterized transport system fused permease/ATPase subunit
MITTRNLALPALAAIAAPLVYLVQVREMARWREVLRRGTATFEEEDARERIGNVDLVRKVSRLLPLAMGTRETVGYVVFCAAFLLRTVVMWWRVAANGNVLAAFAFGQNRRDAVLRFAFSALAQAAIDSVISNLRFWLIASIRETLSAAMHKLLMRRERFARARYEPECDAATSISRYCGEFAEHFAELPYYFLSPSFDAIGALLYFYRSHGIHGTRVLLGTTVGSLLVIRRVQPDLARMHSRVVTMEGAFQKRHFDVQEHSEAISMAAGSGYFYDVLNRSLHQVYAALCRYGAGTAHSFLLFRVVDLAVWELVPLVLWLRDSSMQGEGAVRELVVQREAVRNFTRAVAILFKNTREISHLKEFTDKLCTFLDSLDEVDRISHNHDPALQPPRVEFPPLPELSAAAADAAAAPNEDARARELRRSLHGTVLRFTDVTVSTPSGLALQIQRFTLSISNGEFYVIVGHNASGKTSLFRTVCGLWPPSAGAIALARDTRVLCLPQQSFLLPKGSLREQLWFPLIPPLHVEATEVDCARLSLSLAVLDQLVDIVGGWSSPNCGFAPARHSPLTATSGSATPGGIDSADADFPSALSASMSGTMTASMAAHEASAAADFSWMSLSGGQSQKLAMARLFFTIHMTSRGLARRGRLARAVSIADLTPARERAVASASAAGGEDDDDDAELIIDGTAESPQMQPREDETAPRRFLVLLDESTSQIDSDAELRILTTLRALPQVTLMIISHRKAAVLAHATHVLVIGERPTPTVMTVAEFVASGRSDLSRAPTTSFSPASSGVLNDSTDT